MTIGDHFASDWFTSQAVWRPFTCPASGGVIALHLSIQLERAHLRWPAHRACLIRMCWALRKGPNKLAAHCRCASAVTAVGWSNSIDADFMSPHRLNRTSCQKTTQHTLEQHGAHLYSSRQWARRSKPSIAACSTDSTVESGATKTMVSSSYCVSVMDKTWRVRTITSSTDSFGVPSYPACNR